MKHQKLLLLNKRCFHYLRSYKGDRVQVTSIDVVATVFIEGSMGSEYYFGEGSTAFDSELQ